MRVHVDVTHPAHVHLFRPAIEELTDDGHAVAVTSRDKEVTTELLDAYGIEHCTLSAKRESKLALGPEWALRTVQTARFAREFEPDVLLSHFNPAAILAARATGTASVVFNDSETAGRLAEWLGPLADQVHSPVGVQQDLGEHHHRYRGFHELAYLRPERFESDPELLREHGVDPDEDYSVLRTVSMGAYHDVGAQGLSPDAQRRLVGKLAERGPVYVSSEAAPQLADGEPGDADAAEGSEDRSSDAAELGPLARLSYDLPVEPVPVPPAAIHHLLAEASVFVGDSDTMAIEAGVLGTPSVRVNCFGEGTLGCFAELDRYGLVESTTDEGEAAEAAVELLDDPEAGQRWARRRERLLEDTVDVTAYVLEQVEAAATGQPSAASGASDAPTERSVAPTEQAAAPGAVADDAVAGDARDGGGAGDDHDPPKQSRAATSQFGGVAGPSGAAGDAESRSNDTSASSIDP